MLYFNIRLFIEGVAMLNVLRQAATQITGRIDGQDPLADVLMELSNHLRDCGLLVSAEALDQIILAIVENVSVVALKTPIHVFNQTPAKRVSSKGGLHTSSGASEV